MNSQLYCAKQKDHIIREPVILDCDDFICRACIPDPDHSPQIICSICGASNPNNIKNKVTSKSGMRLLEEQKNVLFQTMLNEFNNNLHIMKNEKEILKHIETLKVELDVHGEQMKSKIDTQIFRCKTELDYFHNGFKKLLNKVDMQEYVFKRDKFLYLIENDLQNVGELYELESGLVKTKSIFDISKLVSFNKNKHVSIGDNNFYTVNTLLERELTKDNKSMNECRPWNITDNDIEYIKSIITAIKPQNEPNELIKLKHKFAYYGESKLTSGLVHLRPRSIQINLDSKNIGEIFMPIECIVYCAVYFRDEFLVLFLEPNRLFHEKYGVALSKCAQNSERFTLCFTESQMYTIDDWQDFFEFVKFLEARCEFINFEKTKKLLIETIGDNSDFIQKKFKQQSETEFDRLNRNDIECLNANRFLNGKIVDAYLEYLVDTRLNEDARKRVVIEKSNFYTNILKKNMKSIDRNNASDIDILNKDFIFVPILDIFHWSLVIICYPSKAIIKNENKKRDLMDERPVIILVDPLKRDQSNILTILIQYLEKVWETSKSKDDYHFEKFSFKFIYADVPNKTCIFDSGLFLLSCVEEFIKQNLDAFDLKNNSFTGFELVTNAPDKRDQIAKICKQFCHINIFTETEIQSNNNDNRPKRTRKAVVKYADNQ